MEEREFQEKLKAKTELAEQILKKFLPREEGFQRTVVEAMNYSVLAGGKRLRPILMHEVFYMLGGKGRMIEPFMAAIEMIHTYSLVHDDLPAMDNDEYRRGQRTTWTVYGEAVGILAGDGLLNFAFETALRVFDEEMTDRQLRMAAEAVRILASKAGVYGMIGGQTADIEAENQKRLTNEQLMFIHKHKTAALIEAAMMIGACLAGAEHEELEAIEKCACNIGIAFQIQDDILDVTGDSRELGKMTGSDAQNHKQTYVTINGLEQSGQDVERLSGEAVRILNSFEGEHGFLQQLIVQLINRKS